MLGDRISADAIMRTGFGFWASKTLLSAVELGLFTELAAGGLPREELRQRLGLHERGARDFFDALVAVGFLQREGDFYSNAPEADFYLDRNKPSYIGGVLDMAHRRLWQSWASLTEALRTGLPQNEAKHSGDFFGRLYSDPEQLKIFLNGMSGTSIPAVQQISNAFPWAKVSSFADIGTAQGAVPVQIARDHNHLQGIGFDLPPVQPVFEDYVRSHGLEKRLTFLGGDFLSGPLPSADVLIMGHILHDWDQRTKDMLLAKAFAALPEGGALIVYDMIIDDERRDNAFGLLMSLNMLIETPGGFDYTGAECSAWMTRAGFKDIRIQHLTGPYSMVVGTK